MIWTRTKDFSGARLLPLFLLPLLAVAVAAPRVRAQSLPDAAEAINKARITSRVLFITAHPDDEWSSVLAYCSRGENADVALLTLTRGQGGQNAIGPEQDGELGVIRTTELLAAGKHYGVRQYFTRALDFGFSKSPDQTMKIWGDLVLEDMVRVIRTYRPDVVINGWGGVHSGHGHHQASGILTPRAVEMAADPTKFPEQIKEGLPAWKTRLVVRLVRSNSSEGVSIPVLNVSPLWGESYAQMGMEGHALHLSQGTPAFSGNSFFRSAVTLVAEAGASGTGNGKFDPKILAEPLPALARKYPQWSAQATAPLTSANAQIEIAEKDVLRLDRAGAATALAEAGKTIATLRESVAKGTSAEARGLAWDLEQVSAHIDLALEKDVALPVTANAERHELVAGESLPVRVDFEGGAAVPVQWTLSRASLVVPQGWSVDGGDKKLPSGGADFTVKIPAGAKATLAPSDVILPFPAPYVALALPVRYSGYEFTIHKAVDSTEATTTGIFTYPLETDSRGDADCGAAAGDGAGAARLAARGVARADPVSRDEACDGDGGAGRAARVVRGGDCAGAISNGGRSIDPICGDAAGAARDRRLQDESVREHRQRKYFATRSSRFPRCRRAIGSSRTTQRCTCWI